MGSIIMVNKKEVLFIHFPLWAILSLAAAPEFDVAGGHGARSAGTQDRYLHPGDKPSNHSCRMDAVCAGGSGPQFPFLEAQTALYHAKTALFFPEGTALSSPQHLFWWGWEA